MVEHHPNCINGLNICLVILAFVELIVTSFLCIVIPEILEFTNTQYATCSGLIAALFTVPVTIRMKLTETSPFLGKLYGHRNVVKKFAVVFSLLVHSVAVTIAVISLIAPKNFASELLALMKKFRFFHSSRKLINEIQSLLQCCGSKDYKEWFLFNWQGLNTREDMNSEEIDVRDEDAGSVPYSCCSKTAVSACRHYNLREYGTATINRMGCANKVRKLTRYYLLFLLLLYCLIVAIEICLVVLYDHNSRRHHVVKFKSEGTSAECSRLLKEDCWESFTNTGTSCPQIMPSSHTQIFLNQSIDMDTSSIR